MAKRDNTGPHARKRADVLLVERGLFESRARAQAAIEAGFVTADGKAVTKVSETIDVNAAIEARPAHPYVSRGGVKLAGALGDIRSRSRTISALMSAPRPAASPKCC